MYQQQYAAGMYKYCSDIDDDVAHHDDDDDVVVDYVDKNNAKDGWH